MSVASVVERFQDFFSDNLALRFSNGRPTLGQRGIGNLIFFMSYLCMNRPQLLEFCTEAGLLKSPMTCIKCSGDMRLGRKRRLSDGFVWICRKKACGSQRSIRFGSWFGCSKLNLEEILLLTFCIVKGDTSKSIRESFFFSPHTLADWRQFINETILDYVELHSEKIGGPGKIVEIDESKFGKRKFNRGHPVEGQWVFGGVERGSGKLFLVAVHDRSAETLLGVIENWIEKGSEIYSDSWKAYDRLGDIGYTHLKVNHRLHFVDPDTGCHTNNIENRWRIVKTSLPSFNRQADFQFYLAAYMFHHSCIEKGVDDFNAFLEIVRDVKWEEYKVLL